MAVVPKDKSLVVRSGERKMTIVVDRPQGLPRSARAAWLGAAARLAHRRRARNRVGPRMATLTRRHDHGGAGHRHARAAIQPPHGLRRREQLARPRGQQRVGAQHQPAVPRQMAAEISRKRTRFIDARSTTVGSSARKNRMALGFASVSIRLARNARQPCCAVVGLGTSTRSAGAVHSFHARYSR